MSSDLCKLSTLLNWLGDMRLGWRDTGLRSVNINTDTNRRTSSFKSSIPLQHVVNTPGLAAVHAVVILERVDLEKMSYIRLIYTYRAVND